MLKSQITTLENKTDVFTHYKGKRLKGEFRRGIQRRKPSCGCWKSCVTRHRTEMKHKAGETRNKGTQFFLTIGYT